MRVVLDGTNLPSHIEEFVINIASHVDMTTGPDGALYYANQSSPGTIRRLATTSTAQNLIVQPTSFNVVEGGSSVFSVRLNSAPAANVTVTTSRISGDVDLTVSSGASLTFTPANFSVPQLVRIAAAQDRLIPPERSRRLAQAWGGPAKLEILEGRDHNNIHGHPLYWEMITQFLGSVTGRN